VKCAQCGTELFEGPCPACAVRAAPENIVGYSLLPRPLFNIYRAQRGVKALASRRWGAYHRFLNGKSLEPDEREVCRLQLESVGVYTVDHEARAAIHPVCIVTDRRVMAQDEFGHFVQLQRSQVRAANVHRQDDSRGNPSYYLAVERVGSAVHDIRGDISFYCRTRQECEELASVLR
jgi:hypothetical protein